MTSGSVKVLVSQIAEIRAPETCSPCDLYSLIYTPLYYVVLIYVLIRPISEHGMDVN